MDLKSLIRNSLLTLFYIKKGFGAIIKDVHNWEKSNSYRILEVNRTYFYKKNFLSTRYFAVIHKNSLSYPHFGDNSVKRIKNEKNVIKWLD